MSWIQTYTGRKFWPADPSLEDIDIADIGHALSMTCRYGGHCSNFYSVAEHSVILSKHVAPEFALWALLHDASEAYLVDVPRPVKALLTNYREIEIELEKAIAIRFGLCWPMPAEVKAADDAILTDEMRLLMEPTPEPWATQNQPLGVRLHLWGPDEAKLEFIHRFNELTGAN